MLLYINCLLQKCVYDTIRTITYNNACGSQPALLILLRLQLLLKLHFYILLHLLFLLYRIFLEEHKLSHVFVPKRKWKEGPGKTISAFIITALHYPGFRFAV